MKPFRRPRRTASLQVEILDRRDLLAVVPALSALPIVFEQATHATLPEAQDVGFVNEIGGMVIKGAIATSPLGGEVDWYRFDLSEPATISLATLPSGTLASVLSLYNSDPFNFNDYYNPFGHRLLAQGSDTLSRKLAAGTYYVGVSGDGNEFFSPFLANSGYAGASGSYALKLTSAPLGRGLHAGPVVLTVGPKSDANIRSSPLDLRVNFSTPLDAGTLIPGDNVRLIYNPDGSFGTDRDQPLDFQAYYFNSAGDELQLIPAAPLTPGYYQLYLGTTLTGIPDDNGISLPLGADAEHLDGRDFLASFRVTGNEGRSDGFADDTPAFAHSLGNVTHAGLVQAAGAIGDDATDPTPFNSADVDLYSFKVCGAGRFALTAEAFARRIGSPLDVGLSLFRVGDHGELVFVAANENTLNDAEGTNGTLPLFSDAALFVGLIAGDYFIAVSSQFNVPDPFFDLLPGTNGIFDPHVSHSGAFGSSTGAYLLNLGIVADNTAPRVTGTSPAAGLVLSEAPTYVTVQFSESINLQALTYQSYVQTSESTIQAVYIVGSDNVRYLPRLESWNEVTHQATFLMLDGLANGAYELHFSGPLGLADFAGNALVPNDLSGEYIVSFAVNDPASSRSDRLNYASNGAASNLDHPMALGVLFPHDLQFGAGVTVTRDAGLPLAGAADYYQFRVLQSRPYFFDLLGSGFNVGASLTIFDANGNMVDGFFNNAVLQIYLDAGTYTVAVAGWDAMQADPVAYRLEIKLGGADENPTPLTVGPAPMQRFRLADLAPATPTIPQRNAPAAPSSNPGIPTIPTDVLLALGRGPIGGVSGNVNPPANLAFLNGLAPADPVQVASLADVTATQASDAGGSCTEPSLATELAAALEQSVRSEPFAALVGPSIELLQSLPVPSIERAPSISVLNAAPQQVEAIDQIAVETPLPVSVAETPRNPWTLLLTALTAIGAASLAYVHVKYRGLLVSADFPQRK